MLGYKVLYRINGKLVSKADRRLVFPAVVGQVLRMPPPGIFLSTSEKYVLDYYSDGPDAEYDDPGMEEVLLTLEFSPKDILRGNLTDDDPEAAVSSARVMAIEPTAGARRKNPVSRPNSITVDQPIVLWHGAHRWNGPPEIRASRLNHVDHGPGIYLTTSVQTARRYALGGGSIVRFELDPNIRWLKGVKVSTDAMRAFVSSLPRLRSRKEILRDIDRSEALGVLTAPGTISLSVLINLFSHYNVLSGENTIRTARWIVENGADADLVPASFSDDEEDWVVLFNPALVRSTRKVPIAQAEDAPLIRNMVRTAPRRGNPAKPARKASPKKVLSMQAHRNKLAHENRRKITKIKNAYMQAMWSVGYEPLRTKNGGVNARSLNMLKDIAGHLYDALEVTAERHRNPADVVSLDAFKAARTRAAMQAKIVEALGLIARRIQNIDPETPEAQAAMKFAANTLIDGHAKGWFLGP